MGQKINLLVQHLLYVLQLTVEQQHVWEATKILWGCLMQVRITVYSVHEQAIRILFQHVEPFTHVGLYITGLILPSIGQEVEKEGKGSPYRIQLFIQQLVSWGFNHQGAGLQAPLLWGLNPLLLGLIWFKIWPHPVHSPRINQCYSAKRHISTSLVFPMLWDPYRILCYGCARHFGLWDKAYLPSSSHELGPVRGLFLFI